MNSKLLMLTTSWLFLISIPYSQGQSRPNIVLIYADDLGYGDVQAYNQNSKIPTPNIDKLADNGILFLDAHSGSTICSPSRYELLTGSYSWRTTRKKGNPAVGEESWI